MALFRYDPNVPPYVLEVGWAKGKSHKKSPITVQVMKRKEGGGFERHQVLGTFKFDQKKESYTFKSKELGDIHIRFVKRLLLFTEVEVTLGGQKLKGSEVLTVIGDHEIAHVK